MFCWFFRLLISHALDEDKQPSGITRKHMSGCADCHHFFDMSLSLAENLKQEEAISNDRISRRLNKRILRAIPARRAETHKVGMKFWVSAAAACMVLIFLIGALLLVLQKEGRDNIETEKTQMAVAIQELRTVYNNVGRDLPTNWPKVIEKPLTGELKSLTNDTESAVRFLVACVSVNISDVESKSLN
jgi:predicted anti-sigma-YlaC factor YlaD